MAEKKAVSQVLASASQLKRVDTQTWLLTNESAGEALLKKQIKPRVFHLVKSEKAPWELCQKLGTVILRTVLVSPTGSKSMNQVLSAAVRYASRLKVSKAKLLHWQSSQGAGMIVTRSRESKLVPRNSMTLGTAGDKGSVTTRLGGANLTSARAVEDPTVTVVTDG
jgi:hypothetical protein